MADSPSELQMELEKLERKHAENPEGRYFVPLANAYRKLGNLEMAEQLLRQGLRHHPDYLSAHIVLGRALADRDATREAEAEFRYVLGLDPQNLIALRTLGEIAQAQGRRDEAEEWYRELLAVDPMNDDARRALESLEPAGGIVPADSFEEGVSWWERPLEEPSRTPAPPRPHAQNAEPEPAPQPEPEPEPELPDTAPDPNFQLGYAGEWLQLDDNSDVDAPEERGGEGAGVSKDDGGRGMDHWGRVAGLPGDASPLDLHDDEAGAGAEADDGDSAPELITETIAELYARQGFHDRAAQVYRELIRRRGGDAALQRRLEEVELLARGEVAAQPAAPVPVDPETGVSEAAELSPPQPLPVADEPDAPMPAAAHGAAASDVDAESQAPSAQGEAGEEPDVFAASLDDGFGAPAAKSSAGDADWLRLLDDQTPAPEAAPAGAPAAAEPVQPLAETGADQEPSIGEYLARLAAWTPGTDAPAEPLPEAEPLPVWSGGDEEQELKLEDEPLPFSAWAPVEPPLPEPEPESHPEPPLGTISAADVLFPWEVGAPEEAEAAPPAAEPDPELDPAHGVLETAGLDAGPETVAEPEPQMSAEPEPQATEAPAADEDDDLESFQAWLRSLKR